jgi:hypothetical protein
LNNHITAKTIVARLDENRLRYSLLDLQNGVQLLVSEYGGRVYGPFLQPGAESLFWIPAWFKDRDPFRAALERKEWNLGGERNWVSPEIQYIVVDRPRWRESSRIQTAMDPGLNELHMTDRQARLHREMTLEATTLQHGQKTLTLDACIRPVDNPLRLLSAHDSLMSGVQYFGYTQAIELREAVSDDILSETWNLVQLNPGGSVIIPCSPRVEVTNYLPRPVDAAHQSFHPGYVRLKLTGDWKYKTGYKAAHTHGRAGYLQTLPDGRTCLLTRALFINPSLPYPEEPYEVPGVHGDSFHIYNDDGGFGGMGELEANGQTIGGDTGRSASLDTLALWGFVGPEAQIKEIAAHLLGVEIE